MKSAAADPGGVTPERAAGGLMLGRAVRGLALAGGVMLFLLMLLTVIAVVMRKVFLSPILGAQDLSEAGLVVVVFLCMAYGGWTGAHIAVDLVGTFLKGRALDWLDTATRSAGGVMFMAIAWETAKQGRDALESGMASNMILIPHYPFYFLITFGSVLFAIVLFYQAFRSARGLPDTSTL